MIGAPDEPLEPLSAELPDGVRGRFVDNINGLRMHVLEAGEAGQPLLLLLHGFPELAYSWRKVMPALAAAGYHVVAPDQRGYGRTTGWDGTFGGDLPSFRFFNLVQDALELLAALGQTRVRAVIGHDFGSPLAAHCALIRPDVFPAVVMMSAPFAGTPAPGPGAAPAADVFADLARLTPPRKHYIAYYSTHPADGDMLNAPEGLHAFLRAYYHVKSADWPGNRIHPLRAWSAEQLARLPDYYVMPMERNMPQAVAPYRPTADEIAACRWLSEAELAVYAGEFARTGFQGGLQWYRCGTSGLSARDLRLFAGRKIDVPAMFIAGASDWGVHQTPGAFEGLGTRACSQFRGSHLIDGAGHWVQQEQPEAVVEKVLGFLQA